MKIVVTNLLSNLSFLNTPQLPQCYRIFPVAISTRNFEANRSSYSGHQKTFPFSPTLLHGTDHVPAYPQGGHVTTIGI